MKRVFKYPIPIADQSVIELPSGAKLLSVQNHAAKEHDGKVYLWASH